MPVLKRRVKREAGAIPARLRHCEQRARRHSIATASAMEQEGRRHRDDLQVRRPASDECYATLRMRADGVEAG